ncbi:DNA cytosine methyltransferase [Mangrovactinospora gilvigrisea]
MRDVILDLFAGPGGWAQGLAMLGRRDVGLEIDPLACATRAAAGHLTIRCDLAAYPVRPFMLRVVGLIASPPCQSYSTAGHRLGLLDQPLVLKAITDLAAGRDTRTELLAQCRDPRSLLAAEPMRYLAALLPHGLPLWVLMEEVPLVLPLWRAYAHLLRPAGFSVWTGILNAADFGVPQTRRRAILIASRTRPAAPPEPTHAQHPEPALLFGTPRLPWVSMAQALGWGATTRPSPTVLAGGPATGGPEAFASGSRATLTRAQAEGQWLLRSSSQAHACLRPATQPAATVLFGHRGNDVRWIRQPDGIHQGETESVRITDREAALLQTFPAGYPFAGPATRRLEQIGNAVPPLLAAHLAAPHLGLTRADVQLAA